MGKLHLLSNPIEIFRLSVCLQLSNDRGEFELDWARYNKNFAKNLLTLGHGTTVPIVKDTSNITEI